jgi:transposase InsO family protein
MEATESKLERKDEVSPARHIDFSFINITGTFSYLCSALNGCSRYIVSWDIRTSMEEADAEIVLQRGREASPPGPAADHLRSRQPDRSAARMPGRSITLQQRTGRETGDCG